MQSLHFGGSRFAGDGSGRDAIDRSNYGMKKATAMVAIGVTALTPYFQCSEWRGINWQVSAGSSPNGTGRCQRVGGSARSNSGK